MPDLERDKTKEEIRLEEIEEKMDERAKFMTGFMRVVGENFKPISEEINKRMREESRITLENYATLCAQLVDASNTMTEVEHKEEANKENIGTYIFTDYTIKLATEQKENIENGKLDKIYEEFTDVLAKVVEEMGGNQAQQFIFNPEVYDIFKDPKFDAIPLSEKDKILKKLLAKAANIDPENKDQLDSAYKNWSGSYSKDENEKGENKDKV